MKGAVVYSVNYVDDLAFLFPFGMDNLFASDYFAVHNSFVIKLFADRNLDSYHLLLLPIIGTFHLLYLEH